MTAGEDEACICHLINFPGLSAPLDGVLYAPLAGHGRCGGWLVHGMLPQGPTMSSPPSNCIPIMRIVMIIMGVLVGVTPGDYKQMSRESLAEDEESFCRRRVVRRR